MTISELQAENERLQRECLEWQAALHHAETEARQCGFSGSIREPGPALLEILAERDRLQEENTHLARALAHDLKTRTQKPDFDTFVKFRCGPVYLILTALQNGEISRARAAESLAEWAHGVEPLLPEISDCIPEDVTPLMILRERDEARAQAARLAEALRTMADYESDREPEPNWQKVAKHLLETIASTDARKWMREEIAKELTALLETRELMDGSEDPVFAVRSSRIIDRIAELRRED